MACQITMHPFLGGADPGGSWEYTGVPASGTFNIDTGGDLPYAIGAPIGLAGQGENTTIDVSGTANGTYTFDYTVGTTCAATTTLTITVNDGAIQMLDYNPLLCTSENFEFILFDYVQGGDGTGTGIVPADTTGAWTGGAVNGPGHTPNTAVATDDTFNPTGLTPGNYTFIYSVDQTGGGLPGCDNCTAVSTVIIAVTDAADAGTSATITLCNAQ